jgi:hypothetical protein
MVGRAMRGVWDRVLFVVVVVGSPSFGTRFWNECSVVEIKFADGLHFWRRRKQPSECTEPSSRALLGAWDVLQRKWVCLNVEFRVVEAHLTRDRRSNLQCVKRG